MDDAGWSMILAYLYNEETELWLPLIEEAGANDVSSDIDISDLNDQETQRKFGLRPEETQKPIEFLINNELIEVTSKIGHHEEDDSRYTQSNVEFVEIKLTNDGFNVAHERKIIELQHDQNKKSTRVSSLLVLAVAIQALAAVGQEQTLNPTILSIVVLLLVIGVWVEISEPQNWLQDKESVLDWFSLDKF